MFISPYKHISPFGGKGSSPVFSIANSFYLDGTNEYFGADSLIANISSDTVGTINVLTKSVNVTPTSSAYLFTISLSNGTSAIYGWQRTDGKIEISAIGSGAAKFTIRTTNAINLTTWTLISFVQNGTQPKILINGVEVAQSNITISDLTFWLSDTTFNAVSIGALRYNSTTTYGYNGYISQVSYLNTNISSAQCLDFYNSGTPKSPQSFFGANCKFFFNPDNSGSTAQFSVVDSVNSITATSVNMEDADKTPITPYSNPIADLVTKYGFLNAWSGENIGINGTTITVYDYLSEHNLSNPAVANKPTFSGGDASFNNRPILSFDGIDDYLTKAVANWRAADTSGVVIGVTKQGSVATYFLGSSDSGSTNFWSFGQHSTTDLRILRNGALVVESLATSTDAQVVGFSSNGTANKTFLNGVDNTDTNGSPNWLSSLPTQRDDVSIGAVLKSTPIYSAAFSFAFIGYLPYTNDAAIINCQNELKTIFGL